MENDGVKKRKVSKKTKKSWRKFVDTKDVDRFLDDVRLEERFGGPFSSKKNEELFTVDTQSNDNVDVNNILTKQERRKLLMMSEPKCYSILKPHTAVPDPISKRNRVKTPEERKSAIRKQIEAKKRLNGHLKLKEKTAIHNRQLAKIKRENKPKRGQFKVDVWTENIPSASSLTNEWVTNDTKRHTLANTGKIRKRLPDTLHKKPSVLPAVTAPHPGISYNPSFSDHQSLLNQLAEDEKKLIKEEKHLDRVTSKMFKRVTHEQKENDNLKEMSEGLPLNEKKNVSATEAEDDDPNVKSVNPPVKNLKKTLVQRRKQKEQKKMQHQRVKDKVEKKKVADIYHLKQLGRQIVKKQQKENLLKEKKSRAQAKKILEPKVLSRNKFEPLEQEFNLGDELSGNLRNTLPVGNLLKDRYKSLQQRNVVAPGRVVLKKNKSKVKRFTKADHKINLPKNLK